MIRTIWFNGAFVDERDAKVSIFDRGLLFADAVYEGLGVLDGQIVDFERHMARLRRSLGELSIAEPMTENQFFEVLTELIRRNGVGEGFIYLQITRGVAERDYLFPDGLKPNMFAFTQPSHGGGADDPPEMLSMASTPDLRWVRRDIKTTNLLGQVLAKRAADAAGADEALMIDPDGFVTEGGAVSFFIVDRDGRLHVRPLNGDLLPGVTRSTMLDVARELGIETVEDKIRIEDAYAAREAFVTGASSYVQPVGEIDGRRIGDGTAGAFTLKLRQAYLASVRASFVRPA
ncbi:MAG: aminotransferase class IV [Rhodospirillales bacterium]